MAEEFAMQGLSGTEILEDILAQLKKRLIGDCNLRPSDSYSRGYSAKITYSVLCFGLDQQTIDGSFELGEPHNEVSDEGGAGELVIDQEEDLSEVRDRIEKAKGSGEEEVDTLEMSVPTGEIIRQKRKYTRKVQLTAPGVNGGAEEFKD